MGKVPRTKKEAHTYHKDAVRPPRANMHIGKRNALIKTLKKISLMRGEHPSAGKARFVQRENGRPWGAGAEARFNWTNQELLRAEAELDVLRGGGEGLVPADDDVRPDPAVVAGVPGPAVGAGPAVFDIPVPAVIAASGGQGVSGSQGASGGKFSGCDRNVGDDSPAVAPGAFGTPKSVLGGERGVPYNTPPGLGNISIYQQRVNIQRCNSMLDDDSSAAAPGAFSTPPLATNGVECVPVASADEPIAAGVQGLESPASVATDGGLSSEREDDDQRDVMGLGVHQAIEKAKKSYHQAIEAGFASGGKVQVEGKVQVGGKVKVGVDIQGLRMIGR